jgi:hypothetical protein
MRILPAHHVKSEWQHHFLPELMCLRLLGELGCVDWVAHMVLHHLPQPEVGNTSVRTQSKNRTNIKSQVQTYRIVESITSASCEKQVEATFLGWAGVFALVGRIW